MAGPTGVRFQPNNDVVPGRFFLPEIMGTGLAWLDYDGDGLWDLFAADGGPLDPVGTASLGAVRDAVPDPLGAAVETAVDAPSAPKASSNPAQTGEESAGGRFAAGGRLFRNRGVAGFEEVMAATRLGPSGYMQGCAVGDYDADGFPDLYVACFGRDSLWRNQGDGTFVELKAAVSDEQWSTSAAWLDADSDGDLDLYVVSYLDVSLANSRICRYDGKPGYCGPGDFAAVPDRLWLSQGDGTFVDALEKLGFSTPQGKGLAIVAVDLDADCRAEVYVANDMDANLLFTRGRGGAESARGAVWTEVGMESGSAVSGTGQNEASMGIACADFDGDGLPDIYLTHYFQSKNTLYRNLGGLRFHDDSYRSRAAVTSFESLGFGSAPVDFDRDGAIDLFVANGHVLGPAVEPFAMTPQLLWNDGRGRLYDASGDAGPFFQESRIGRSVASADYDNDGDLDMAMSHVAQPIALLRNDTRTGRHFLGFELRTRDRVPPVGGRIEVVAGDVRVTLPVIAGGSYLAASDPRVLAGIGANAGPARATIFWPSGRTQVCEGLVVDRYWVVYEGEAPR
ncbi:MAG: CRTAC1 family protein [Planctomycetota bacterium]